MPAIARDGDPTTTGHGCDATTTVTGPTGAAAKVFANGIAIECIGNPTAAHTIKSGKNCVPHGAVINAGSGTVFVGGIPIARVGDSTDGGKITAGSNNVFTNGEGGFFGGGYGFDLGGGGGNVVIGPGGSSGEVKRDPNRDYSKYSFFENARHDRQYFAAEYVGMDYLPKTGNAALPLETRRELLREYAIKIGFAPDAGISTGPDGEISFLDPNYRPPIKLQDYINETAIERGYLDSQGRSTLPLDYQQLIDQAQLASLYPYIQAQLERVSNGEQTIDNPFIPSIEEIAAAAAAAVASSADNPYRDDPNLLGGPVQDI
jgi:uncharacterized Zn-binding protein involved in type VI secretion